MKISKTAVLVALCALGASGLLYLKNPFFKAQASRLCKRNEVIIDCKLLDQKACSKEFSRDFLRFGYQPIVVTISNTSDQYIKYTPTDITLKVVPSAVVAKDTHRNTFLRTLVWKVGSFFNPFLAIPGAAHSALEEKANNKLDKKCLSNSQDQLIAPKESIQDTIFVRTDDYQEKFTLLLTNKNAQKTIVCDIDMAKTMPMLYSV
ncbi:MAG: hypothetical protein AB7R69_03855 [Candidatus Babeliales bacterium]